LLFATASVSSSISIFFFFLFERISLFILICSKQVREIWSAACKAIVNPFQQSLPLTHIYRERKRDVIC
jgi:hypothetical protein